MSNTESIFDFLDEMRNSDTPEEIVARKVGFFLRKKARETDTPYHGHFELTPLCNLNCRMCYVHLDEEHLKGRSLLLAEEWERLIQESIEAGMAKATLSGGECLTYPWFDQIYLFLKSKGIATSVLTNGVLLDRERICFFKDHPPLKLQVSLYGSCDDAYARVTGKRAFGVVIENIKAAKEAGLPIKISVTPSKYMLDDVKEILKLAKNLDVPYAINLGLMTPREGTGREHDKHDVSLDDYIDIIRYNRILNNTEPEVCETTEIPNNMGSDFVNDGLKCGAGRSTFSINWYGAMTPCTQMTSIEAEPLRDGFKFAWQLINREAKSYPRFTDCEDCVYSHECDFCPAENEKIGSRFNLNPVWCERTWKMVENGLRIPDSHCD